MGTRLQAFRTWKSSTMISAIPVLGAGTGGDLLQVGPVAALYGLIRRDPTDTTMGLETTIGEEIEEAVGLNETPHTPSDPDRENETLIFSNDDLEFFVRNWGDMPIDEAVLPEFQESLAWWIEDYLRDPYGETDRNKWLPRE